MLFKKKTLDNRPVEYRLVRWYDDKYYVEWKISDATWFEKLFHAWARWQKVLTYSGPFLSSENPGNSLYGFLPRTVSISNEPGSWHSPEKVLSNYKRHGTYKSFYDAIVKPEEDECNAAWKRYRKYVATLPDDDIYQ